MIFGRKCIGLFNIAQRFQHNLRKYGTTLKPLNDNMYTDIVWIDLEMTGLDVDKDRIIEIACLITNSNLKILSTEFHAIIHQPDELMNSMGPWCTKTHNKTGLSEAVRNSRLTMADAERQLLSFIKQYIVEKQSAPVAGNSVYMDRLFMRKQMPIVDDYLHYRIIDVSTLKELAKRWYPDVAKTIPTKTFSHRAIDDIKESIEELKFYRQSLFKN